MKDRWKPPREEWDEIIKQVEQQDWQFVSNKVAYAVIGLLLTYLVGSVIWLLVRD